MIDKIQIFNTFFNVKHNFVWATPPQIPDDINIKNKPHKKILKS